MRARGNSEEYLKLNVVCATNPHFQFDFVKVYFLS